jgi:hypothetical protein
MLTGAKEYAVRVECFGQRMGVIKRRVLIASHHGALARWEIEAHMGMQLMRTTASLEAAMHCHPQRVVYITD